ncbi:ABC transporter substrate-binding protein [Bordetella genomosp. 13]|uniref:ABC transporter substrate-binding protein n=1 Tax=Bordetella genomosp. 13 TaxID=463040 RepID=UPI0011A80157|nr:ABC transporter substrate-binding protein [Bordetella genomosp. 13]
MRATPLSPLALAAGLALAAALPTAAHAADSKPQCEVQRPVRFTGLNWESNLVLAGIERFILENGYGCKTQMEPGETLAMLAALQRGDVDVTPEVWPGQIESAWDKALASKKVMGVGQVYEAGEGWYIPRYTAERHPDLKRAADLARYKDTFTDPEEPNRGRIYGCPAGWACGTLNDNLLRALKLEQSYTMFAPGSGAAQKAAIVSAYKRKRDIVFYYWTPTALVGALDLVKLELPAFDQKAYSCITDPKCADPVPTEFKPQPVVTGLNADFARQAPQLQAFFTSIKISSAAIDGTLGWLENEGAEPEDAAKHFLKTYAAEWKQWVPAEVAQRVQAAL